MGHVHNNESSFVDGGNAHEHSIQRKKYHLSQELERVPGCCAITVCTRHPSAPHPRSSLLDSLFGSRAALLVLRDQLARSIGHHPRPGGRRLSGGANLTF
jgi:hypothetical protein